MKRIIKISVTLITVGLFCCHCSPCCDAATLGAARKKSKSDKQYEYVWKRTIMNGSRTGCVAAGLDNIPQTLGKIENNKYIAPNGKVYTKGSIIEVARLVLAAQPSMADVKEVVGYSPRPMVRRAPESEITNWFADMLMDIVREKSGKKVDLAIANFGGVRVDMPQGEVTLDDIMSMFPFKNNICYVALKGREVREILEHMAKHRFEILGGVRCVAKNHKLISAEIDGQPIDDDKVYGVATISFLLNGGDGLSVAKNAVELKIFKDYVLDAVLPYIKNMTAQGKNIEYKTDGRVKIIN